jgi:3-phytase
MNNKQMNNFSNRFFLSGIVVVLAISCVVKRPSEGSKKASLAIEKTVLATAETDPVPQSKNKDSADDPAIWINRSNPEQSFIIGTDKKGGLATYDLNGKQLNYYAQGAMNNSDVRYDFPLSNGRIDIVASSNRTTHSIALHKISAGGILEEIHARIIESELTGEVYGLCMYKSHKTGKFYVFLNSKQGGVEQWELFERGGKVDAKLVRAFQLRSKTEGMVADDQHAHIYIGEEEAGIHKYDAEPEGSVERNIIAMSTKENTELRFDLEGLSIYDSGSGNGYLIASSQGNYSYAVFERQGDNKYLGSFRIVDGEIDGAEETDGIDVTNIPLGEKYPKGMFVVQDGYNYDGKTLVSQNFKYVSWEDIEKLFRQ